MTIYLVSHPTSIRLEFCHIQNVIVMPILFRANHNIDISCFPNSLSAIPCLSFACWLYCNRKIRKHTKICFTRSQNFLINKASKLILKIGGNTTRSTSNNPTIIFSSNRLMRVMIDCCHVLQELLCNFFVKHFYSFSRACGPHNHSPSTGKEEWRASIDSRLVGGIAKRLCQT